VCWKRRSRTPGSGRLSLPVRHRFDPASIPQFSAIRCCYRFGSETQAVSRYFVCVAHVSRHAFCLKATSQTEAYENRPDRRVGIVFVPAGTLPFFNRDTIIQPDNQLAIPYFTLTTQHASGEFAILGAMYDGFAGSLAKAVRASHTMSPQQKARLLGILGL